jgi:hypothetical protein
MFELKDRNGFLWECGVKEPRSLKGVLTGGVLKM